VESVGIFTPLMLFIGDAFEENYRDRAIAAIVGKGIDIKGENVQGKTGQKQSMKSKLLVGGNLSA
jgi:hypothetical protein